MRNVNSFWSIKIPVGVTWPLALILFFGLGAQALPISAAPLDPKATIAKAVDEFTEILSDQELAIPANRERRHRLLVATAENFFDFKEISMRVMGPRWRELSDQERASFTEIFKQFLKSNYIARMDDYAGEQVLIDDQEIREDRRGNRFAMVKTRFGMREREIQTNYLLLQRGGDWLIYDVNIEGVSLVRNFRTQFEPHSFNELIRRMEESIAAGKELRQS